MPRQTVFEAAENGSLLDELRAVRAVLAGAMDSPKTLPRDLAALSRRQMELSRQIARLEAQPQEEELPEDEQWDAGAAF